MWQTYKRKTYKKSHFIQDVYDLHVIWKKLKHKISKDCKTIFFSKENVAQLSQTPSSNQVEAYLREAFELKNVTKSGKSPQLS